jgi:hypothetical protein
MKMLRFMFNRETRNILKLKKFFIKPNSKVRLIIEGVHFFSILYSTFALPVMVGFREQLFGFYLIMEYFILAEGIFYTVAQLRVGQYEAGILSIDSKTILKS